MCSSDLSERRAAVTCRSSIGRIGYVVVAMFVGIWALSLIVWRARRIEARWGGMLERSR